MPHGFEKLRPQVESEGDVYKRRYRKEGRIKGAVRDFLETAKHKRMIKRMPRWRARDANEEETE